MLTLKEFGRVILFPESDKTISLLDLVSQVETGRLKAPPHQREFIWTEAKCKAWADTLIKVATPGPRNPKPLGLMVTYQLTDNGGYYLNDGWQRVNATIKFIKDAKKYKLAPEEAERVVQAYEVFVQHRWYDSATEAMYWFQMLQLGTALTNYDFCKGYLEYLPGDTNWMPLLSDLHTFMNSIMEDYANQAQPPSLNATHNGRRHNYALFYRWLTHTRKLSLDAAQVATKNLDLAAAEKGKMIEQKLGAVLQERGIDQSMNELAAFKVFLKGEAEVIAARHSNAMSKRGLANKTVLAGRAANWDRPSHSLTRWLLNLTIWRRNNQANQTTWAEFLSTLFMYTDSTGRISRGDERPIIIGMDKSDRLRGIAKLIDFLPYKGV